MTDRVRATSADRAAMVIGGILLVAFASARITNVYASTSQSAGPLRLDPNTAAWYELLHVEGVGDTLARRIVEDRERHGPFESIDSLTRVRGIGEKSLAKMRPDLEIGRPPRGEEASTVSP